MACDACARVKTNGRREKKKKLSVSHGFCPPPTFPPSCFEFSSIFFFSVLPHRPRWTFFPTLAAREYPPRPTVDDVNFSFVLSHANFCFSQHFAPLTHSYARTLVHAARENEIIIVLLGTYISRVCTNRARGGAKYYTRVLTSIRAVCFRLIAD